MDTALVLFTRDPRVHDNPALADLAGQAFAGDAVRGPHACEMTVAQADVG